MEQKNRSQISKDELNKFLIALLNSNLESKNHISFYKDEKTLRIGENITQANTNYDSVGAASFCIVVIVWYFFGVVAFVTWQMKKKTNATNRLQNRAAFNWFRRSSQNKIDPG